MTVVASIVLLKTLVELFSTHRSFSCQRRRLVRHLKHDRNLAISADRAFEARGEPIEREAVAAGPHQRFHVEFSRGVAPRDHAITALHGAKPDAGAPSRASQVSMPRQGS